ESSAAAHALFQEALACQRTGQLVRAETLYRQVVAMQPGHPGAHHLLGTIALQKGAPERACELIRLSIAAQPRLAHSHADLGRALQTLGRPAEAVRSYDRALELQPTLFEVHFNKALALRHLCRFEEALRACHTVLELRPGFTAAACLRAGLLADLQRTEEAVRAYDRLLERVPDHAEAFNNRGALLLEQDRLPEALHSFEQARRLSSAQAVEPNEHARDLYAGATLNCAITLTRLNRLTEAEASLAQALRIAPRNFAALVLRSRLLKRLNATARALECIDAALQLHPDNPEALLLRAEILTDLGRYADAATCLISLPQGRVTRDYAQGLHLHLRATLCEWSSWEEKARDLITAVDASQRAVTPCHFLAVSDSAASQQRCARTFTADRYPPAPALRGAAYRHDKIRIAYVSADLREHPVARLLARVLELHDRGRFHTIAISLRPAESSALGERIRAAFDEFIDASDMDPHAIAALISRLEVDIAVDLMGYTGGAKPELLALRPAPIQVNWLGFPGTMGAPFIDYIIADEFVLPREQAVHYDEKAVWLPDCFQPNESWEELGGQPVSRAALGLPSSGFVFSSFNNQYKITPDLFAIWMRLLHAVPESVLWLFADEQTAQSNLRQCAARHDLDPQRLIFAARAPYGEHLARLQCADLFLDTFPFNAGASASAALQAGLPIVTQTGQSFAARMAGSLLHAIGLPELVTRDRGEYESVALRVATTPGLLAELRSRLRVIRSSHPLFDSERFCRHLERAYDFMWQRSVRGEPPESFAVEATLG
ncbi:MAG TPA: tetratricopeptide repeat protein, partial [Steroidobacteraceae bacterium]|nr:tetratricopeptide repeat protein [Steroidobacteraceae bacterium]